MKSFLSKLLIIAMLPIGLAGCGSMSNYEKQSDPAITQYKVGNTLEAATQLSKVAEKESNRRIGLLWSLEAGKAHQAAQDWENSKKWFTKAEERVRSFDDEAVITAKDTAAESTALLLNPNTLAYKGTYTDRIYLNIYQSLNYLCLGELEGAAVEARRARHRQDEARKNFAKRIVKDSSKWAWGFDDASNEKITPVYAKAEQKVTPAAAKFMNPFATWLNATIHFLRQDFESARFEMRNLIQMGIIDKEIENHLRILEKAAKGNRQPPAYVFVVFESGLGPNLTEEKYEFLLPEIGYTKIALPNPVFNENPFNKLSIEANEQTYRTTTIASADSLFSAEFQAGFSRRFARLVSSWIAKEVAARTAQEAARKADSRHDTGGIFSALTFVSTTVYKYVTNRADTRTWRTRGNELQVAAFPVPADGRITIAPQSLHSSSPIPSKTKEIIIPESERNQNQFIFIQGIVSESYTIAKKSFPIY